LFARLPAKSKGFRLARFTPGPPSSNQGAPASKGGFMRILITNDDGINAPGLEVLTAIATDLAGPGGEVWTVAPAFEQSGVGHCISYTHPMMIAKLAPRRYAAEGSPADCVLAALYDVLQGAKPDLVLSGVNRGNNSAENVLYSGTIGGAMEAALQGLPAIALSQFMGPDTSELDDPFQAARMHGAGVIRALLDKGLWDKGDYRLFYNVNFPPVSAAAVKGTRVAAQGFRRDTAFSVEPHMSPSGRKFLWIKGGPQQSPTLPGTDAAVNLQGYISVTPMRADLTAHDRLAELQAALG
jgi:5'-nucleotidase